MRVSIEGADCPVGRATRDRLLRRGHVLAQTGSECAVFFPGLAADLERIAARAGLRRLVVRSHAFAYGSSVKNPGLMTEDRVSLLPANAPERRWLAVEAIAARHPSWAAVRLTNVLDPAEGDLLVRQLSARAAMPLAGHDPNVQFISVEDAAGAIVAAIESQATGIFNAAGEGAIPLKKAFRAAATRRIPILKPLARLAGHDASVDQLQYNWTVSSERLAKDLHFSLERSTTGALAEFLTHKTGARPDRLQPAYDNWGLDPDYIRAWGWWFAFLRHVYWRIDHEGLENIPESGRAIFVSNHRGFMPLDAVMHLSLILTYRRRIIRFLIIHSLLKAPFLCNFLTKLGGVIASTENAARLLSAENLVGIFPEGIRGAFSPYRTAYQLRDFGKSAFVKIAIENQAPIIPAAVIGHAEIFPIIGRIDWSYISREYGWPYLPIAPMFPLAPVPLPSKWHVRVLPAVPLGGLKPADAENNRLVKEFSRHVRDIIQRNTDDMLVRRRSIFWGRILNGSAPSAAPFRPPAERRERGAT
jgi:1-acyl-sn-glycerol-3-phosphate acyltransferase